MISGLPIELASAKTAENVYDVFEKLAKNLLDNFLAAAKRPNFYRLTSFFNGGIAFYTAQFIKSLTYFSTSSLVEGGASRG